MNHNKISLCQNTINHQDCNFFALWRHINAFEYYMRHIVRSQLIICTNKQKIAVLRKWSQKLCDRCWPCPQHLETVRHSMLGKLPKIYHFFYFDSSPFLPWSNAKHRIGEESPGSLLVDHHGYCCNKLLDPIIYINHPWL